MCFFTAAEADIRTLKQWKTSGQARHGKAWDHRNQDSGCTAKPGLWGKGYYVTATTSLTSEWRDLLMIEDLVSH